MARALEAILGDRISAGLRRGQGRPPSAQRRGSSSPRPVIRSPTRAGSRPRPGCWRSPTPPRRTTSSSCLISGGGSALTPAPGAAGHARGQAGGDAAAAGRGRARSASSTPCASTCSRFKGGLLARAAWPATVLTLALSDVIGDPLDVIASGPTAPDPTRFADALAVLERRGVVARTPPSVLDALAGGRAGRDPRDAEAGRPRLRAREQSGRRQQRARRRCGRGWRPRRSAIARRLLTLALEGEAREVARDLRHPGARHAAGQLALIAGGETTVTVRGAGRGGRCQEFALAAALDISAGERRGRAGRRDRRHRRPHGRRGRAGRRGHRRARSRRRPRSGAARSPTTTPTASWPRPAISSSPGRPNTNLLDLYLVLRS